MVRFSEWVVVVMGFIVRAVFCLLILILDKASGAGMVGVGFRWGF